MAHMIGERIGEWTIDAEAGQDHKGRAWRGHVAADPSRRITIKVLASSGQVPDFHDLFRGRIAALRKLSHPNVVTCLGGGFTHDPPGSS